MRFLQFNLLTLAMSLSVLSLSSISFAQAGFLTSTNNQCQVYLADIKDRSVQWQGQCEQGKASGQGTAEVYNSDGSKRSYQLEGVWQAGVLNRGTMTSLLDKYIGEFKDGKKHGQGTWDILGMKYVGEWIGDKRHGQGTFTWANGDKYVGEWKDNKRHGQGTFTLPNGNKYVGEYKDDKRHGQGTFTLPNGNKYVGEYKDDKRNGQGTYTSTNDGTKYVGEWKDDKRHGQGTFTFADGAKYVGQWQGDKQLKGTYYWHDGGKVSCNSTSDCQAKLEAREAKIAEKKATVARSSSSSSVSSYRSTPQAPKYYQCKFHCQGSGLARRSGDLTDTAPNLGGSYEASEFIKKKYKAYCEAFPFHSNGAGRASVSYVSCDAKYY